MQQQSFPSNIKKEASDVTAGHQWQCSFEAGFLLSVLVSYCLLITNFGVVTGMVDS